LHLVGFIIRNLSRCTVIWTSNCVFHLLYRIFGANGVYTVHITLLVNSMTVSSDISIQIICYIQSLFRCARTHIHVTKISEMFRLQIVKHPVCPLLGICTLS
jgi:hypothetical protein